MAWASKGDGRLAGRPREPARDLDHFDYNAPAELFLGSRKSARSRPKSGATYRPTYQRFDTAAEALRYVIEGLPAAVLPQAWLVVEEARFRSDEIRYLYDGAGYPLARAADK